MDSTRAFSARTNPKISSAADALDFSTHLLNPGVLHEFRHMLAVNCL
ncbi:hypothetical protein [Corynebacterium ulcerans]|nr:hypothetical protein [Corynebacterium ulcerans]QQU26492.1 hypothetical protein I6I75_04060 [Corynebacterium ulcerans]